MIDSTFFHSSPITRWNRAGAISTFLGTTRDTFEEKTVTYLEYEAYPEMALKSMLEICSEVREASPIDFPSHNTCLIILPLISSH